MKSSMGIRPQCWQRIRQSQGTSISVRHDDHLQTSPFRTHHVRQRFLNTSYRRTHDPDLETSACFQCRTILSRLRLDRLLDVVDAHNKPNSSSSKATTPPNTMASALHVNPNGIATNYQMFSTLTALCTKDLPLRMHSLPARGKCLRSSFLVILPAFACPLLRH